MAITSTAVITDTSLATASQFQGSISHILAATTKKVRLHVSLTLTQGPLRPSGLRVYWSPGIAATSAIGARTGGSAKYKEFNWSEGVVSNAQGNQINWVSEAFDSVCTNLVTWIETPGANAGSVATVTIIESD